MFYALERFGQSYFHQDFANLYGSADGAVREFHADASKAELDALLQDLRTAIRSDLSDAQIEAFWVEGAGANFDPLAVDQSYREWFTHVIELLEAGR